MLPARSASSGGWAGDAMRFVAFCRDRIVRELTILLEAMFPRVSDALTDLADKAESSTLNSAYLDAARLLQSRRGDLETRFLLALEQAGQEFLRRRSVPQADHGEGPSSPAVNGELEESLAIGNLVSKAESRYRLDLAALRDHLAHLLGETQIDASEDPVGPQGICDAFGAALKSLVDLDVATRLVVWKLFDKHVMDHIGAVYAGLARDAGLSRHSASAANLRPEPSGQAEAPGSGPLAKPSGFGKADISPQERPRPAEPAGEAGFKMLQGLLTRDWPRRVEGMKQSIPTGDLVAALSRLQTAAWCRQPDICTGPELRRRLGAELGLRAGGGSLSSLGQPDEDALDLMLLLFEHILHGNELPDAVKVLISRLQIPFVKLALLDKSLFDFSHHPARRLLNHLAELALGWSDDEDPSSRGIYERVEGVVNRVLSEFDRETGLFELLDGEVVALMESERRTAAIRESEVRREAEGRDRQRDARQTVLAVIQERLRWYDHVPDTVIALVYEGWQEVLLAAYEHGGMAGEAWRGAIQTLDRLVWSVQPKVDYGDRRELLRSIPELLRSLRDSLAGVYFDNRRLARWIRELQTLHMTALRGTSPVTADEARALPVEPDTGAGDERRAKMVADRSSAALARARPPGGIGPPVGQGLRIGEWIEIRRDGGSYLRVKLTWYSILSDRFLFVDRQGRKALELTSTDIATLSAQGALTALVWDIPIVDRALQAVVRTLKK
jgi:hypothetical protein